MRDQRVDALAQILVRYSTKVQKGDVCSIAATAAAEPLVQAVYEEVLRAGGLPIMHQNECVGAIGVSGVQSHEDEQIAQAGIKALG